MRILSLTSVFVFLSLALFSQKNETLLTIGDKKISGDEFLYIYKKISGNIAVTVEYMNKVLFRLTRIQKLIQ